MNRLIIISIISFLLVACQKDQENSISDYQYFPIEVGQYQLYEVNESIYSISAAPITRVFFVKEKISEKYITSNGEYVYKIERSKRNNSSQTWRIDSVWTTEVHTNKVIRTTNNLSLVKLIFPIQSGQSWNINEYNNRPKQLATSENVGESFLLDNKNYPKTVSVIIRNDSSLISKKRNIEVYAKQYGMIFQENTNLSYCQSTPSCIGKKLIDFGIEQKTKLIEIGIEN